MVEKSPFSESKIDKTHDYLQQYQLDKPVLKPLLDNATAALNYALAHKIEVKYPYTPPSWPHYPHCFLWDSGFAAIIYARFNLPHLGENEIRSVLLGQNEETGFIPNMIFLGRSRWFDVEKYTFLNPALGSSYTQPPVLATAAFDVYCSYKKQNKEESGKKFLGETYPNLKKFYEYFWRYRRANNNLIAVIHPHETGRDSDPTFDFFKTRIAANIGNHTPLPQNIIPLVNTALDYVSALSLNVKLRKEGWQLEKAKEIFWVNDVMFNCIYVDNLKALAEIAQILENEEDKDRILGEAQSVEEAILTQMWDENEKQFFAQKPDGPIKTVSVSNLFPLILDKINENQLLSILAMIESKDWFNTYYPLPSVPVNSPAYDPSYREKRLWRGPVWINTNWYLITKGLLKQAKRFKTTSPALSERCFQLAKIIAQKTEELINQSGLREFYNPETGEGYRVNNFTWSALGYGISKGLTI